MAHARTLVTVLALNEAASIPGTIQNIRHAIPWADVLVIDDGSADSTAAAAAATGVMVVRLPYNVGIGAAEQVGFRYALARDYAVVVRNDGDGQHVPEGIAALVEALQDGAADVVIGSRHLAPEGDYGTPPLRRAGGALLSAVLRALTGQAVTDPTSGFRAFNQRAIRYFAVNYPHDYPEPELIIRLHRAGLTMCERPVHMVERSAGRSSITPLRSATYMLRVLLAIGIETLRQTPRADIAEIMEPAS
jgi:glycosyltransferase involved in cell wall biosynthesis